MFNENTNYGNLELDIINTAYFHCRNRDFEKAYNLINSFVEKYRISFYPIICLNLEKYEEAYIYYNSTFRDESVEQINLGDDEFIQKCAYSLVLCIKAFEFQKEMDDALNIYNIDENKKVSISQYLNAIEIASQNLNNGEYVISRNYFKKALKIANFDPSLWLDFASTYYTEFIAEESHFNLIEAYMALKCATILEENDVETPVSEYDFQLHYSFLNIIFKLKALGLEQPKLVSKEISKLKACASSQMEMNTAVQLEINIKGIERDFPF
ncbi:MAG: hypothetical protein E7531_02420 [Ruminococcaceae bacterium]|nr:hypothetical protein [Oscillospiraceae bacterium]